MYELNYRSSPMLEKIMQSEVYNNQRQYIAGTMESKLGSSRKIQTSPSNPFIFLVKFRLGSDVSVVY